MQISTRLFGSALSLALISATSTAASPAARQIMLEQRGDPLALQAAHKRSFAPHPIQSSAFWAQRGETLSIEVSLASKHNPELWIVPIGTSDVTQIVTLRPGYNSIRANHNGVIYFVAPFSQPQSKNPINITLSGGGREIPRFVLGQHSLPDWHAMLQRLAREPYAELVGKRMIITMPLALVREHVDDPSTVLELWDKIVTLAEEQYGLAADNPAPHHATPFQYQFVTKNNGHGYMSAGTYWLGTEEVGAIEVLNSQALQQAWGPWHELGHHYQMPDMTWDHQTEVTNNLTSLYVQRALGQRSRLETDQVWTQVAAHLARPNPDYQQGNEFVRVAMLWQLDLAFGRDFYSRLGKLYRSKSELPARHEDKQQTFILETSRVSGHDLTPFFTRWGLKVTDRTRQQLAALQLDPLLLPIWQNRDDALRYTYARSQQPVLKNQWVYTDKTNQRQYHSLTDFERAWAQQYRQNRLYHWDERVNRIGAVYFFQNPENGRREYYMQQGAHSFFPGNGQSNRDWRYLGSRGDFVDMAETSSTPASATVAPPPQKGIPSTPFNSPLAPPKSIPSAPLSPALIPPKSTHSAPLSPLPPENAARAETELARQHGQERLYQWDEHVHRKGAVYFHQNPHNGRREYFMLQGMHTYLPINGKSTQNWLYLGSSGNLTKPPAVGAKWDGSERSKRSESQQQRFLPINWWNKAKKYRSTAELEHALIRQYGRIYQWHEKFAAPGSLYVYANPYNGQREYFEKQPQTSICAFFPANGQSNRDWRYLGRSSDFIAPPARWQR